MSKKVAEIIVETIKSAGVKRCYGIVGDTLNEIAAALQKEGIEWIHTRHEEAAAFAAQGDALLTDTLTACAGSCGPGSLHFINGIVEANRNRAPIVLIASQVTREELGFDFIQEVDFKKIYESCSVFCDMILTPGQARRKTVMACQAAIAKRGVAVLIVPVDISQAKVADDSGFSVHISRPIVRPSEADLDRIAALINSSERVAIYGGSGCQGARDEVMALAERIKAPVGRTSRAKEWLEHDNPHDVGMTGILGTPVGYHTILDCDTLLLLGADFAWRQFYPEHARIIQIDIDPMHLGRRHPVDVGVAADVKDTLTALLPRLDIRDASHFYRKAVEDYRRHVGKTAKAAVPHRDGSIPPRYLMEVLDKAIADDALVAADDGTPVCFMVRQMRGTGERRFFSSLLHGTMASAMPTAIGLKKAVPHRQVVALCGDGGLAMLFGDLMTLIQEKLPIKLVVFNNSKLGFVALEQKSEGLRELYTDLVNPDFGKVASAMGLWGRKVTEAGDLEAAVSAWLAEPGPALLDVAIDPMTLIMPPTIEFGPAYGMALYSAKAILHGEGRDVWEMVKDNVF